MIAHRFEFFLAGRVENFQLSNLIVDQALLDVRILDGRIVVREEEGLDELNGDGRLEETVFDVRIHVDASGSVTHFADATTAEHDDLVRRFIFDFLRCCIRVAAVRGGRFAVSRHVTDLPM